MAVKAMSVRARVEARPEGEKGPRMRVILGDERTAACVDVTGGLVATIAHAIWQSRGGESMTNWADAELVLDQLLEAGSPAARSEIKPSSPARTSPVVPASRAPAAAKRKNSSRR